jgi:hypothetical protein
LKRLEDEKPEDTVEKRHQWWFGTEIIREPREIYEHLSGSLRTGNLSP